MALTRGGTAGGTLELRTNERGFTASDIMSIARMSMSSKHTRDDAIGSKGIGFKSVFAITERVEIHSGHVHIEFNTQKRGRLGMVWPESVPGDARVEGTHMIFPLKPDAYKKVRTELDRVAGQPEILLFLRNVRRLELVVDGHTTVLTLVQREPVPDCLLSSEGFVCSAALAVVRCERDDMPLEETRWLLQEARGRSSAHVMLAFPLDSKQLRLRCIYGYLPLAQKIFSFAVHGPWILPSTREAVVQSDPRNAEIAECIPHAFVAAYGAFTRVFTASTAVELAGLFLRFVPVAPDDTLPLYTSAWRDLCARVGQLNCLPAHDSSVLLRPVDAVRCDRDSGADAVTLRRMCGKFSLSKFDVVNTDVDLPAHVWASLGVRTWGVGDFARLFALREFEPELAARGCDIFIAWCNFIQNVLGKAGSTVTVDDVKETFHGILFVPLDDGRRCCIGELLWFYPPGTKSATDVVLAATLKVLDGRVFSHSAARSIAQLLQEFGARPLSYDGVWAHVVEPKFASSKVSDAELLRYTEYAATWLMSLDPATRVHVVRRLRSTLVLRLEGGDDVLLSKPCTFVHFPLDRGAGQPLHDLVRVLPSPLWRVLGGVYAEALVITKSVTVVRHMLDELGVTASLNDFETACRAKGGGLVPSQALAVNAVVPSSELRALVDALVSDCAFTGCRHDALKQLFSVVAPEYARLDHSLLSHLKSVAWIPVLGVSSELARPADLVHASLLRNFGNWALYGDVDIDSEFGADACKSFAKALGSLVDVSHGSARAECILEQVYEAHKSGRGVVIVPRASVPVLADVEVSTVSVALFERLVVMVVGDPGVVSGPVLPRVLFVADDTSEHAKENGAPGRFFVLEKWVGAAGDYGVTPDALQTVGLFDLRERYPTLYARVSSSNPLPFRADVVRSLFAAFADQSVTIHGESALRLLSAASTRLLPQEVNECGIVVPAETICPVTDGTVRWVALPADGTAFAADDDERTRRVREFYSSLRYRVGAEVFLLSGLPPQVVLRDLMSCPCGETW